MRSLPCLLPLNFLIIFSKYPHEFPDLIIVLLFALVEFKEDFEAKLFWLFWLEINKFLFAKVLVLLGNRSVGVVSQISIVLLPAHWPTCNSLLSQVEVNLFFPISSFLYLIKNFQTVFWDFGDCEKEIFAQLFLEFEFELFNKHDFLRLNLTN